MNLKDVLLAPPARVLGSAAARSSVAERCIAGTLRRVDRVPGLKQLAHRTFHAYKDRRVAREGADAISVAVLPGGARMFVRLLDAIALSEFTTSYPEPATMNFMQSQIRPDDVFLDIGACFGMYSFLVAPRLTGSGRVHAFEPFPAVGDLFRRSIAASPYKDCIDLLPFALSAGDGERKFFVSQEAGNFGIGSLTPAEMHFESGSLSQNQTRTVACRSLDSVVRERRLDRIDVIKIDVEGAELDVLEGMADSLARLRPRLLQIETSINGPVGEKLRRYGYREWMIESLKGDWGNVGYALD